MKIDISSINKNDFCISERLHDVAGKVLLVTPGFGKHLWNMGELHLRSIMTLPDGTVLDSGFPKFRNYGENSDDDILTRRLIADGKVLFAEKMDGSLIIRSVINGKVCFRTRGSHTLGEGADFSFSSVLNLVSEKYPNLLNPKLYSDSTLLFEYTSPNNKIIISYDDDKLTTLGMMIYNHSSGLPAFRGSKDIVLDIANTFAVEPVSFYDLPDDLDEVARIVKGWSGVEGIVVWGQLDDGTMHLAKIKAEEYIRIHSFKYNFSSEKIKKLCYIKNIETIEQLKNEIYLIDMDWELVSIAEPYFNEYLKDKHEMQVRIEIVRNLIASNKINLIESRKEVAMALMALFSDKIDFNIGINICTGNEEQLKLMVYANALGISVSAIKSLQKSSDIM